LIVAFSIRDYLQQFRLRAEAVGNALVKVRMRAVTVEGDLRLHCTLCKRITL